MTALLRHLLRTRVDEIAATSYLDCHCRGLHSLLLVDKPGALIRMFVVERPHNMYRNFSALQGPLSIAFHAHDADPTLHVVRGQIANVTFEDDTETGPILRRFRYSSEIRDGRAGFQESGQSIRPQTRHQWLLPGESLWMPSTKFHTVAVRENERAAWFVYEGAKDPAYDSIAYSDADLENFSADGMYRRPTPDQVRELLNYAIGGEP